MSLPVWTDHTKMSNESLAPAQMISPLGSSATDENCIGVSATIVLKFRYLTRSNARTVPSKLELKMALFWENNNDVTGALCSLKVTKQNPLAVFHTLIFPSSPPVAMYWPSGEYAKLDISRE